MLLLYSICILLTQIKETQVSKAIAILVISFVTVSFYIPEIIEYGSGSATEVVNDTEILQHDFIGNFEVHTLKAKTPSDLTRRIADIFALPDSVCLGWSDDKFLKMLYRPYFTPGNGVTGNDLRIEDSPGNFTIERENGIISGITYYSPSGIPIKIIE